MHLSGRKMKAAGIVVSASVAAAVCFVFSSCILNLGPPVARKVRRDTVTVEGADIDVFI